MKKNKQITPNSILNDLRLSNGIPPQRPQSNGIPPARKQSNGIPPVRPTRQASQLTSNPGQNAMMPDLQSQ